MGRNHEKGVAERIDDNLNVAANGAREWTALRLYIL